MMMSTGQSIRQGIKDRPHDFDEEVVVWGSNPRVYGETNKEFRVFFPEVSF